MRMSQLGRVTRCAVLHSTGMRTAAHDEWHARVLGSAAERQVQRVQRKWWTSTRRTTSPVPEGTEQAVVLVTASVVHPPLRCRRSSMAARSTTGPFNAGGAARGWHATYQPDEDVERCRGAKGTRVARWPRSTLHGACLSRWTAFAMPSRVSTPNDIKNLGVTVPAFLSPEAVMFAHNALRTIPSPSALLS
jgi:hypothetical protein